MSQALASDSPAVMQQLRLASRRLNADCELCKLSGLFDSNPCLEPDLRFYRRGATVVRHGCQDNYLYSVRSGAVKLVSHPGVDEESVIGFHFSGDLFGFENLAASRSQHDAIALEDSVICRLPARRVYSGTTSSSSFNYLVRLMGDNALNYQAHAAMVNRRQAGARLASFLLDIAGRLRSANNDPLLFQLPMSRVDIASYLGLTVETVSRRLSELQRQQLLRLDVRTRSVTILDLQGLQQLALY